MYTHLTEQLADQHQAELHAQSPKSSHASPAHHTSRTRLAPRRHRHPIRRRTGYALVALGLRLAAGED